MPSKLLTEHLKMTLMFPNFWKRFFFDYFRRFIVWAKISKKFAFKFEGHPNIDIFEYFVNIHDVSQSVHRGMHIIHIIAECWTSTLPVPCIVLPNGNNVKMFVPSFGSESIVRNPHFPYDNNVRTKTLTLDVCLKRVISSKWCLLKIFFIWQQVTYLDQSTSKYIKSWVYTKYLYHRKWIMVIK